MSPKGDECPHHSRPLIAMGPDGRHPVEAGAIAHPASRLVAAVGAAAELSFAIQASHFPKHLAGRANGALNLFHIVAAFVAQYATGVVLQHWTPEAGRYPEIAYQTAFALNLAISGRSMYLVHVPARTNRFREKASRQNCVGDLNEPARPRRRQRGARGD